MPGPHVAFKLQPRRRAAERKHRQAGKPAAARTVSHAEASSRAHTGQRPIRIYEDVELRAIAYKEPPLH